MSPGRHQPHGPTCWGQCEHRALTVFTDVVGGAVPLLGPALLIVSTLTADADRVFCGVAFRDQLFPCK